MYCPNCKQEFDGKFCPECGTKLIEKPAANDGPSINLGDANAINGNINVTDSRYIHHEDKSVHNVTNTSGTIENQPSGIARRQSWAQCRRNITLATTIM